MSEEQAESQGDPSTEQAPAVFGGAPTVQPPLPVVSVFAEHGRSIPARAAPVKTGTYVDAEGVEVQVQIVAERPDGSRDILIPAGMTSVRRDAVRRKEEDGQKGDYLK